MSASAVARANNSRHVLARGHPAVEVVAGPAGGHGQVGRIEEVGPDLEGLHAQPLPRQPAAPAPASATSCPRRCRSRQSPVWGQAAFIARLLSGRHGPLCRPCLRQRISVTVSARAIKAGRRLAAGQHQARLRRGLGEEFRDLPFFDQPRATARQISSRITSAKLAGRQSLRPPCADPPAPPPDAGRTADRRPAGRNPEAGRDGSRCRAWPPRRQFRPPSASLLMNWMTQVRRP